MPLQLQSQILDLLHDYPRNPNAIVRLQSLLGYIYTISFEKFCDNHDTHIDLIDILALQMPLMFDESRWKESYFKRTCQEA